MNSTRDRNFVLYGYCFFYYGVMLFLVLDGRLLSQLHPIFLTYNRDLTELLLIGSGIPALLMKHGWVALLADGLALLFPALIGVHVRLKSRYSPVLGIAFSGFLALYLLLINLFWQADHEPFMLYLFLSLAFWTNRPDRFDAVMRFCRYYFCYVFVSAALWKIARGAVFQVPIMSNLLLEHQADLLSDPCHSLWCRITWFLIGHPVISWTLYMGAVLLELIFIAGFFTRRWDRWLIVAAVVFVAADMWLMRIPYWTLLIGCIPLCINSSSKRPRGIVVYETTHHENLPGLLDLCAAHFEQTAVFLQRVSFDHLSGAIDPRQRWPKASFVIQEAKTGNRAFIARLFRFIRRHPEYTHLHLSTVDNNWLMVALHLALSPGLQASMTIHAVNDYFTYSAAGFKAVTESLAKWMLHRRVKHYTFFLPAMADSFRQRMPDAVAVTIPSRFAPDLVPSRFAGELATSRFARDFAPSGPEGDPVPPQPDRCLAPSRPEGDAFVIVLPGTVDPHRRDYPSVIAFFKDFLAKPIPRPIELVILGNSRSAYGAGIVTQLRQLESGRFRITVFDGYIPEDVYELRYATADLIWAPLRSQKTSDHRPAEVYGQTIASGLTADLQLGHTPVLAPDWLVLPPPFSAAVLPYASIETAGTILRRLLDDREWGRTLAMTIRDSFLTLRRESFDGDFRRLTALDQQADRTG